MLTVLAGDKEVSEEILMEWEQWRYSLPELGKLVITRCYKPPNIYTVTPTSLHHFCDASQTDYGQCSYI